MKVSLYIPTKNSGEYLEKCIDSVLNQTLKVDDFFIVDDGSSDNTVRIAKRFRIKVVKNEKGGLANSRSLAFKSAKNDYVAALDSDCAAYPDWIEMLVKDIHAGVAGVGGKNVESGGGYLDQWRKQHMSQNWGNEKTANPEFLFGCNTLFRKSIIKKVGLYNPKYKTNYEDVDISKRLKQKGYMLIYEPKAIVEHLRKDNL